MHGVDADLVVPPTVIGQSVVRCMVEDSQKAVYHNTYINPNCLTLY